MKRSEILSLYAKSFWFIAPSTFVATAVLGYFCGIKVAIPVFAALLFGDLALILALTYRNTKKGG